MATEPSSRETPANLTEQHPPETLHALLRARQWGAVDERLADQTAEERVVSIAAAAYGLAGLAPPSTIEEFEDRIRAAGTIEEALVSPFPPADCLFSLWERTIEPGDDVAITSCAAAGALALTRHLPLAVASLDEVFEIPNPAARCVFAVAAGRVARDGHATALSLVREILVAQEVDEHLRLAAIRGLGDGLLSTGLAWLSERVRGALEDRAAWTMACEPVADWVASNLTEDTAALLIALLRRVRTEGEALRLIESWCQSASTGDRAATSPLLVLERSWDRLPADARAAMIRCADTEGIELPHDGLDEACGPALQAGLERSLARGEPPSRRRLLRLCTHPDREIRARAFELLAPGRSLGVVSNTRSIESAADVVSLPTARITRSPLARIRVMLSSGEGEAIPLIAERLTPEEAEELIPDLVAALDVPDMAVRRASIETLGLIGSTDELPALLDAARKLRGLAGMVVSAIRQVGEFDDPDELATLFDRRLRWADDQAVDDLVALAGDRGASLLGNVLHTRFYPPVRIGAARAMARHGMRETIFALRIRALTDPHADVRAAATASLRELSGSEPSPEEVAGYDPLTVSVDALDEATDRAAASGSQALPGLRATLAKGTWRRRMAACRALTRIRGAEAEEILYSGLRDIDEDVRLSALHSLKTRGWSPSTATDRTLAAMAERRVDRLIKGDEDLDSETLAEGLFLGGHLFRTEIGAALSHLARQGTWKPNQEELAAWAVTRLEPHLVVRSDIGLEVLLQLIDRTWQVHPFRAALARGLREVPVARLSEAMERGPWRWRTREAACRSLARPGCAEAPDLLATFVLDTDEDVRAAALAALVSVGTAKAARSVSEISRSPFHDDAEAASSALAAIGAPCLDILDELASSPWWEARRLAALALREWHGDSQLAVDRAFPLAVDPEYRVAEAALETLRRHGLFPSREALLEVVPKLQTLTVYSVLQWLPLDGAGRLEGASLRETICTALRELDDVALPYRLGVLSTLRLDESVPWLESLVEANGARHAGVRNAASEALLSLADPLCQACQRKGSISCVRCAGEGEEQCERCLGRGAVRKPCPETDCSAQAPARAIGSAPCKTCRGRSFVVDPCNCGGGTVRCVLCQGTGSLSCPMCATGSEELGSP